jgi:hypothetical protein
MKKKILTVITLVLSFNVFSSTFSERVLTGSDGSENIYLEYCMKTGEDGSGTKTGEDGSGTKTGEDGSGTKTDSDGSDGYLNSYCQFFIKENINL